MAAARRLPEGEALARSGSWKGWDLDQLVGTDVWGKTLGIVGFGRIGRAVARRAGGFQMKVIYTDAVRAPENVEKELKAEFREMNALLAESDFISVHVPLLPETRGLFDATKFQRMKPTVFLINTSRGPVVNEAGLVAALEKDQRDVLLLVDRATQKTGQLAEGGVGSEFGPQIVHQSGKTP